MPKHRRTRTARASGRSRRRTVALRGGALVGALALCAFTGAKLLYSAAGTGAHAAAINGSHAPLTTMTTVSHALRDRSPVPTVTSAAPTPQPAATTPSLRPISGRSVTAVGDSVMVASTPALEQALPGIEINAMVGRQFSTGLQVIAMLKASGQLRPIVVVGLGTNGTVTSAEISQLFDEIGPHRRLVLVSTYEARPWEQEVNSTLAAAASDHPDVVLADWFTTIEHRTYLLWPDGIHPQPAGGIVYARMLKAAVERVGNLPG